MRLIRKNQTPAKGALNYISQGSSSLTKPVKRKGTLRKERENAIQSINQWARQNPTLVFKDNFKNLRLYLNDDTWQIVLDEYPDIKVGDEIYNKLPDKYRANYVALDVRNIGTPSNIIKARQIRRNAVAPYDHPNALTNMDLIKYELENTFPYFLENLSNSIEFDDDYYLKDYDSYRDSENLSKVKAEEYVNNYLRHKADLNSSYKKLLAFDEAYPQWIDALTGGLFHNGIYLLDGSVNNGHFLNKLYRGYRKYINPVKLKDDSNIIGGAGSTIIDLSNNSMKATKNSKLKNILFNEFVETTNPSIYKAGDIRSGKIKTLTDKNIPIKDFSIYSGIQDGAFITGPLNIFNDTTSIFPARNVKKDLQPVILFMLPTKESLTFDNFNDLKYDSIYNNIDDLYLVPYNKSNFKKLNIPEKDFNRLLRMISSYDNSEPIPDDVNLVIGKSPLPYWMPYDLSDFLFEYLLFGKNKKLALETVMADYERYKVPDFDRSKFENFINSLNLQDIDKLILLKKDYAFNNAGDSKKIPIIMARNVFYASSKNSQTGYNYKDINGNTNPISNWNASILDGKFILSNPNGGLFINRALDISKEQLDYINEYLTKHPSYVVRPDLGGFGLTMLNNPTLRLYLNLYSEGIKEDDPNVFAVGTNNDPISDFNIKNVK